MNLRDIVNLVLEIIILEILIPRNEIDKLYYKKGILVKVKWLDGSISKLKRGKWIYENTIN